MHFPDSFLFGAATSSYQIEGATQTDGRGPSIWDLFSRVPGKTKNGDTGDVACDHYHRYPEDVALMSDLGLDAYRFSIAWTRIQATGHGQVNQRGLDFYDRLVDKLLAAQIDPWVCLYHWDLPQALQDRGGWPNRDLVWRYVDYAQVVAQRLGDRVKHWAMFNEPGVHAVMGHLKAWHAPGLHNIEACLAAGHHMNLATAQGAHALREVHKNAQVGTILSFNRVEPASDASSDIDAALTAHAFLHQAYLEPLLSGRYPEVVEETFAETLQEGDNKQLKVDLDWLGLNYYSRHLVEARRGAALLGASIRPPHKGAEISAMGWEVYPSGLQQSLLEVSALAPELPLYVTENGIATTDYQGDDGQIEDENRISYLHRHLSACLGALEQGVDLRGYFAWSLMDNFEWAEGYNKRFGLVWLDYETLERVPKQSFDWYRRLIESRELPEQTE